MRRTVLACVMAAGMAALVSSPAAAQSLADKLAAAKTLTCTFPLLATGTWADDGKPETTSKPAMLTFRFEKIDLDEGTAQMASSSGAFNLIVQRMENTLHFMQLFRAGPLYTTTVFPSQTPDGKFKAVHSRHEYVEVALPGFTSRPEQYYGVCE